MGRKEEYKEKNLQYLQVLSTQEGICPLPCNMFYKVLQTDGYSFTYNPKYCHRSLSGKSDKRKRV